MQAVSQTLQCRPARASLPQRQQRLGAQTHLLTARRQRFAVRAEEQGAPEQQQTAVPPPPQPPVADGTVAPWNRTPSQIDMASQPDALGPVGNALMAILLFVLCAGCVFFTVGRQFQADMVPLTPEQLASMQ